ncbi:MAG: alcohol dehydrogenase catalytic domain-containing protein [Bacteroidales bacterium]|nr:alcohol dehydrogenase catalytic domain-containing protein [Bacteroidales bacterium]
MFSCDQCLSGRHHTCRRLTFLGCPDQASGSLAEYIVIPETSCIKLPQHVSFDEATISEPLSIGLYAVKRAFPEKGMKTAILGYGPIGMSVHLSLNSEGITDSLVTDKIDNRLDKAAELGADVVLIEDEKKALDSL